MLLTRIYEKMVKREGDPPATTLLMGWDNIPIRAEKSLYDLAMWCRQKPAIDEYVRSTDTNLLAAQLQGQKTPAGIEQADWKEFQARFASHLDQFGHIIFQLDFAENLPLDHPEPMLENVRMFLRGEGVNPYERQKSSETRRIQTAENALLRLKGFRRWAFKTALKFGQGLAEVREDALADIGLGYPKLREMLRELGHRFTKAGIIEEADDIFWLKKEEIDALIAGVEKSHALKNLSVDVDERKAYWEQLKEETPPPMMPMKERVMGVKTDVFISRSAESQTGDTIKGVATSPGVVTAQACVINSPEDFGQMRPGYVLVSSTTTPAWTPLFAMASAVVTDIGGPLSHGSIVAREYGIPAVMGTGVATRRIHDGQTIKVDGKAGIVTILG
jgi:phosphoenolpyruvate synthase/pyruvate phosphate dikinase